MVMRICSGRRLPSFPQLTGRCQISHYSFHSLEIVLLVLRFREGREMEGLMVKLMAGEMDAGMVNVHNSHSKTIDSSLSKAEEESKSFRK